LHTVLKLWQERFFVNEIEVNNVRSCNLDSNIASDEIDLSAQFWKLIILAIEPLLILLEKEDAVCRSYNEHLVIQKIHIS
jgi:hypothetical protein